MAQNIKIFIDSNVWFSAFYKKGVPFLVLETLKNQKYEVVISELVLEEVVRNIKNKYPTILPLVYNFFQQYPLSIIKNPSLLNLQKHKGLAEKKDLPILIAAFQYKCKFLITGNLKDFKIKGIKEKLGLRVISPRDAASLF